MKTKTHHTEPTLLPQPFSVAELRLIESIVETQITVYQHALAKLPRARMDLSREQSLLQTVRLFIAVEIKSPRSVALAPITAVATDASKANHATAGASFKE